MKWSIRTLKGPLKRLNKMLSTDSYMRFRIISINIHLFNRSTCARVSLVCIRFVVFMDKSRGKGRQYLRKYMFLVLINFKSTAIIFSVTSIYLFVHFINAHVNVLKCIIISVFIFILIKAQFALPSRRA